MQPPIFLTAEWRYLVMLNYVIAPDILQPLVPQGTELDFFNGHTFISLVGFHFRNTRILGIPIPFHINFEEVNLRFYVRRATPTGWRRGVVFIRELVPRYAIAFIARTIYGEPYSALPMRHTIEHTTSQLQVEYAWKRSNQWESLSAKSSGAPRPIEIGTEADFITDHFWGYTARTNGRCDEYEVEHPRWQYWPAKEATFKADTSTLYGPQFVKPLSSTPSSAFIAEGSPIKVRQKSPRL